MPSNLESGLMFLFDFVYYFFEFFLKLVYIVLLFVANILTNIISSLFQYVPLLFKAFSTFLSFAFWMLTRLIQGILGMGDKTTNTLSWLILLCGCYLYLDYKGYTFRPMPSEQPRQPSEPEQENATTRNNDGRPTQTGQRSPTRHGNVVHRRIIQNIVEQLNARGTADNRSPRPRESGTSHDHPHTDDTYTRHEVENQENENEANSQEEADRTRAQDDNFNNIRREQNDGAEGVSSEGAAMTEDNADSALCIICLDRERNAAVFPCGHTQLCLTCVQRLCRDGGPCPMCQSRIDEYRQIFV